MAGNSNLHMSRDAKEDEYYTDITLIEDELNIIRSILGIKLYFVIVMILMKVIFLSILL